MSSRSRWKAADWWALAALFLAVFFVTLIVGVILSVQPGRPW